MSKYLAGRMDAGDECVEQVAALKARIEEIIENSQEEPDEPATFTSSKPVYRSE